MDVSAPFFSVLLIFAMYSCPPFLGTDIIFLLAFLASWVACGMVLVLARNKGADPWRVIRGVDMHGRICGRDEGVTDKPLAAYPTTDHSSYAICVDSCARTNQDDFKVVGTGATLNKNYGMSNKYESVNFLGYCMPNLLSGTCCPLP